MLKPGGILVGPGEFPTSLKGLAFILFIRWLLTNVLLQLVFIAVGDELVKIVRSKIENPDGIEQFDTRVISGVRFAPLLSEPSIQTVIPACVWDPSNHTIYPDSFRGACNQLLLCSNASRNQPVKVVPRNKVNAASMLPRALWVEILSFTHRNCKWGVCASCMCLRSRTRVLLPHSQMHFVLTIRIFTFSCAFLEKGLMFQWMS